MHNVIQLSLPWGGGGGVADGEGYFCPLTRPGRELSQRESLFINLMTLLPALPFSPQKGVATCRGDPRVAYSFTSDYSFAAFCSFLL
jgi:hypothetical protein